MEFSCVACGNIGSSSSAMSTVRPYYLDYVRVLYSAGGLGMRDVIMRRKKTEKRNDRKIDPAARDLVELAGEGEIDFGEIKRPTRFKRFRINYQ